MSTGRPSASGFFHAVRFYRDSSSLCGIVAHTHLVSEAGDATRIAAA